MWTLHSDGLKGGNEMKYFKKLMMLQADGAGGGADGGVESGDGKDGDGKSNAGSIVDNVDSGKGEGNDNESLDKRIQSAVDKATNKLGNDNKVLRKEIEKLKIQGMTEEEKLEAEKQTKESELAGKERLLLEKENRLYAIEAIKKAGLDSGNTDSLEIIDFVIAKEQGDIDKKIGTFKTLINKLVAAEVDKTFKANGRKPNGVDGKNDSEENSVIELAKKLGTINSESGKIAKSARDYYTGGKK